MQGALPTLTTEGELGMSRIQNFSATTDDDPISQCQVTATVPTKKEVSEGVRSPEPTVSQQHEGKNVADQRPKCSGPFRSILRKTTIPRGRYKKVCEGVFMTLTPIAILCICSIPIILYFTLQVSASMYTSFHECVEVTQY